MLERASWRGNGHNDEAILREAAQWVRKIHCEALSREEEKALGDWLRADARHAGAIEVTMAAWEKSPQMLAGLGYQTGTVPDASGGRWTGWALGTLSAAAAVIVAALFLLTPARDRFTTISAANEARLIALADGSTVQLSPGSTIEYRIDQQVRRVILSNGSAVFDVEHSPVTFEVDVGDLGIIVQGTNFAVEREADRTSVELREGKVDLTVKDQVQSTLRAGDAASYLPSTHELSVIRRPADHAAENAASKHTAATIARLPSSPPATGGVLTFSNRQLGDLVSEIEVRTGFGISFQSADIAALAVSGTVRVDMPITDLEAIIAQKGLMVERSGGAFLIRPVRPQD